MGDRRLHRSVRHRMVRLALDSERGGTEKRGGLPVHRFQNRTDDMSLRARRLVLHIVSEVSAIPDHHIRVLDRFAVNPTVEPSFAGWANSNHAIVNLRSAIPQNPYIAFRKRPVRRGGCHSVVRARNDVVSFAGRRVFHAPFAVTGRVTRTTDFVVLVVQVRGTD
jgi:hypothetical protein